mmetsp:Transcript_4747/g.7030  ORF Transcript_4747/g.7030 Transcript_4747/m.7030 type:complete len:301 (-) Transcript_4747:871-1773(-)
MNIQENQTMTQIETEKTNKALFNFLKGSISGTVGGMAGVIVGHPMDTIKVRLQTIPDATVGSIVRHTLANQKIYGFYKGMLSPLLGEMSNNCILFGVYKSLDSFQAYYADQQNPEYTKAKEYGAIGVSGAAAGVVMSLIVCPTELVKIQLQCNLDGYGQERSGKKGFSDCVRHIVKEQGIRGLAHGWTSTLSRELLFNTAYFLTYEVTKKKLREIFPERDITTCLMSGGAAGVAAWALAYPVDVVKSRVQSNFQSTIRQEVSRGGFKYYRGFSLTLIRAFPVNAVTFFAYEYVNQFFDHF